MTSSPFQILLLEYFTLPSPILGYLVHSVAVITRSMYTIAKSSATLPLSPQLQLCGGGLTHILVSLRLWLVVLPSEAASTWALEPNPLGSESCSSLVSGEILGKLTFESQFTSKVRLIVSASEDSF